MKCDFKVLAQSTNQETDQCTKWQRMMIHEKASLLSLLEIVQESGQFLEDTSKSVITFHQTGQYTEDWTQIVLTSVMNLNKLLSLIHEILEICKIFSRSASWLALEILKGEMLFLSKI